MRNIGYNKLSSCIRKLEPCEIICEMEEVKNTFVPFQVSSLSPPPILRYSLVLNSFASTAISDQAVNLSHPILLFGYPSYKIWFILHLPYVVSYSPNFLFLIYFFLHQEFLPTEIFCGNSSFSCSTFFEIRTNCSNHIKTK